MKRKFLKRITCAFLTLAVCLTGSISAFAAENTVEGDVTLSNANGGIGTMQSDVGAEVTANFKITVPANIDLSNDSGYCVYDGTNVVGIQGAVPADRAVSLAPAEEFIVLTSGSEGAYKTASVPVTQDQIVWNQSDLSGGVMHYTNLHIAGALDPGSWNGKLTFQIKINDISLCATGGHTYDRNHVCTRCGALEGGTYSLQKEFRKSWKDLNDEGIVTKTPDGGKVTAIIDDSQLTSANILVVPGEVDCVGCKNSSQSTGAITELVLMDGVKEIKAEGFAYRSGLESVTIPGSMKKINDSAFRDCTSLTSLTLGDGVETIGKQAFYRCTSLKTFTMPRSVARLGNFAFSYDAPTVTGGPFNGSLGMNIAFTGTKAEWKALQNLDGGQIDFNCRGDGYKVTCTDGTLTYNYAGLASETYRKELL